MVRVGVLIISLSIVISCKTENNNEHAQLAELIIMPTPTKILKRSGVISFDNTFRIRADVSDSTTSRLASYLVKRLENHFNDEVLISDLFSTREFSQSIQIEIVNDSQAEHNPEAYELDITTKNIKITSSNAMGIYYGIHTLIQVFKNTNTSNSKLTIPKMIIKDSPEYSIRGVIIDSNNWKEFLELNLMEKISSLKINRIYISNYSSIEVTSQTYPFVEIQDSKNISNNVYTIPADRINIIISEGIYHKENHEGLLLDFRESGLAEFEKQIAYFSEISWNR